MVWNADRTKITASYSWGQVQAEVKWEDVLNRASVDLTTHTELVFDVDVGGVYLNGDPWKVEMKFLNADGVVIKSKKLEGKAYDITNVHFAFDVNELGDELDRIQIVFRGKDSEYWAGNYGATFENMKLSLREPTETTLVALASVPPASVAAANAPKSSNFGVGFLAGFGTTAALCAVAAYSMNKSKRASVEAGDFQRV